MGWGALPSVVLVGHSLGGAVVTELAQAGKLGGDLLGFAVLDVVEGSAMDALQSMQTYLSTRPGGFASTQSAIDWHIRSRTIRNSVSAIAENVLCQRPVWHPTSSLVNHVTHGRIAKPAL